jgi:hypothetical protein
LCKKHAVYEPATAQEAGTAWSCLSRQGALTAAPPLMTAVLKRLDADAPPLPSSLKRPGRWGGRRSHPAPREGEVEGVYVPDWLPGLEMERRNMYGSGEEERIGEEMACSNGGGA